MYNFSDANEKLSLCAIEYAGYLKFSDVNIIRDRLYLYGRIPLSSYWLNRFPQQEIFEELIPRNKKPPHRAISEAWLERPAPATNDRWKIFYSRNWQHKAIPSTPYKLYVNLHPDSLIKEFDAIINYLEVYKIPVFKFSKDVYNMVRPDKFVAYITDFDTLIHLGEALSTLLKAVKVQPLPFTAAFDNSGAVSCGFDPPAKLAQLFKAASWRGFIAHVIAQALSEGLHKKLEKTALIQYSIYKLNRLGVNTQKWLPKTIT